MAGSCSCHIDASACLRNAEHAAQEAGNVDPEHLSLEDLTQQLEEAEGTCEEMLVDKLAGCYSTYIDNAKWLSSNSLVDSSFKQNKKLKSGKWEKSKVKESIVDEAHKDVLSPDTIKGYELYITIMMFAWLR